MKSVPKAWILPQDVDAEREAAMLTERLWGEKAHVDWSVYRGRVIAQARSPLRYGSQLEVSATGNSSAAAARRLAACLRALVPPTPGL